MTGRIILLRHGQTDSNVARLLDTRPPGAELTELGRQQAAAAGTELAEYVEAQDGSLGRLQKIVCSVALRAQQTAILAARSLAQEAGLGAHDVPVEVVSGIHEISAGQWEMSNSDAAHLQFRQALHGWLHAAEDARMPGGEDFRDVVNRYQPVLEEIARGLGDDEDVIVVSHGAAIRVMTTHAAGVEPEYALENYISNCTFTVLEPRGKKFGQWTVSRWVGEDLA